jgi:hypothetical protein
MYVHIYDCMYVCMYVVNILHYLLYPLSPIKKRQVTYHIEKKQQDDKVYVVEVIILLTQCISNI